MFKLFVGLKNYTKKSNSFTLHVEQNDSRKRTAERTYPRDPQYPGDPGANKEQGEIIPFFWFVYLLLNIGYGSLTLKYGDVQ